MHARLHLVFVAGIVFGMTGWSQTTWYVDVNASPPGNGTLASPYARIQYAISRTTTVAGDTVLVLPGTYLTKIDFLGKAITLTGQAGAASTVIDAQLSGSAVSFVHGEGPGSVLRDLTIAGGLGTGPNGDRRGGGIRCIGSSPTLEDLVITGNRANMGAGVYLENSAAVLNRCSIRQNTEIHYLDAYLYGAGVYATCSSSPTLTDCTIEQNRYAFNGGGIYGAGTYIRCTIRSNSAFYGGGAYSAGCNLQFFDCTIVENTASSIDGDCGPCGGVYGPATLTGCLLSKNIGCLRGGGACDSTLLSCVISENSCFVGPFTSSPPSGGGTSECFLTDCDVVANTVTGYDLQFLPGVGGGLAGGGAVRSRIHGNRAITGYGGGAASAALTHCTLFGNSATSGGGLHVGGGSTIPVSNSILHGNSPDEIATSSGGTALVSYSDVRGGYAGTGNIGDDPRLWGPLHGDFHLKPGSPCIDTGDPTSPLDPDGTRADMGAIPFVTNYCGDPGSFCLAKINSQSCAPGTGHTGTATVSGPDDFHVTATQFLNNKTGFLFWSRNPKLPPFNAGVACLRGPIVRTSPQNSGGTAPPGTNCSGTYDFHFSQAYRVSRGILAGDTIYAQYYSRDPAHSDGSGLSLSDAFEFTVCP